MVSATIIDEYGIADETDLLIADSFAGAAEFVSRYHDLGAKGGPWGRIGLFEAIDEAYSYARTERHYDQMFIDSDFGVRKSLTLLRHKLRSPATRIIVYEEGVGTYRSDVYPPIKRDIFDLLGTGAAFGGCRLTSGILVYDVAAYRSKVGKYGGKPSPIRTSLVDFIKSNRGILEKLFGCDDPCSMPSAGRYSLYLTNWNIDRETVARLLGMPGKLLLKPHPHLKRQDFASLGLPAERLMPAGVPAEVLIMKLLGQGAELTVYHHGSSAAHYLANSGVNFVKI